MSDSDSDCCGPIKKVCSVTSPTEWETVPTNEEFTFKLKLDGKWTLLGYTLKEGVNLPYHPEIEGLQFTFNKSLVPEIPGRIGKKDKGVWKFVDNLDSSVLKKPSTDQAIVLTGETKTDIEVDEPAEVPGEKLNDDEVLIEDKEMNHAIVKLGGDGILQFGCGLCSFQAEIAEQIREHIGYDHKDWEDEVKAQGSGASPHSKKNQNWLPNLTVNFSQLVVGNCSSRCRQAVETDEVIQDAREWKLVWNELLNTTVCHLETVFGNISVPRKCDMREVAATLGAHYPNMFRASPGPASATLSSGFKPSLKILSLNDLASNIIDRFRSKAKKRRSQDLDLDTTPTREKKGKIGKPKLVYGVDNKKFAGMKATGEAIAAISKTSNELDYEKRKAVFDKMMPQIQEQLSNPEVKISRISKRFWMSPKHLAHQFEYLTGCPDLTTAVRQNLFLQLDHLEKFLTFFDKSMEFAEKLAAVETECEVNYDGALLYKYIMIMRFAGNFFDTDGATLLRLESDGPPKTTGPYIAAKKFDSTFIFSLHVEKDELLGTLEIEEAVAAFIHLAFVCDLKYPKEASTLGDILQRQVAKYGDNSGMKCFGSKGKAQTKFDKYLSGLGQVLAQ